MSDVFIFYPRRDIDLARYLFDQLARDREAWADWQGISPTTIYRGIESADSCLFIINPNSPSLKSVAWRSSIPSSTHKRLMTVVWKELEDDKIHFTTMAQVAFL